MVRPTGTDAASALADSLQPYRAKRDFGKTPEPPGVQARAGEALSFVIQKHAASRLHYDFRLEHGGVLWSWAVPKGPSYDPADKRMAIRTEDHPLSYAAFEGTIPKGQYGAGTVIVWDAGAWRPATDPAQGLVDGKLVFEMFGQKMTGLWELVRIQKPGERQEPWLLFKKRDGYERPRSDYDVVIELPDSVIAKPLGPAAGRFTPKAAAPAAPKPATQAAPKATKAGAPAEAPGLPAGAVAAPLPEKLSPQLATLALAPPTHGEWIYEIKFDGYRILTRIDAGVPALHTRNGHDWTAKMPRLAQAIRTLGLDSAWLDGEIVVLGEDGTPSFNALQNAFDHSRTQAICYFLFDLPYAFGHDLRELPLAARRELLRQLLEARPSDQLRFSAGFDADAASILDSARQLKLEGVIAKRSDAPYRSQRNPTWLKLKCLLRQEFVVAGFTDRAGSTAEVGSLLLGVHDDAGVLVSVGSVGTGWDHATAADLHRQLVATVRATSPFGAAAATAGGGSPRPRWPRRTAGGERWVEPNRVVEVSFAEWTPDAQIRHATFVGTRSDKPAAQITRERAADAGEIDAASVPTTGGKKSMAASAATSSAPRRRSAGTPRPSPPASAIKISNPQRVIDPTSGATKLDLVRYYESVAEWLLPHLAGRPVSLVRGPSGIGGELFFQKHGDKLGIPGIHELDPGLWPGHDALLEIRTEAALRGAAQMNVIEFHTWNSVAKRIDKPDRMIFDLDPGEGVAWPLVQEGATLVRALLQQLGLDGWLKTSGGKGLHIDVPLAPSHDYDTVKAFSQAIVQHLAQTIPARFVAKSGPANRVGKIFVDYLRNGHGATTAAAFSARARPGLGVSMPVSWEALPELKSGAQWTIATAREHLSFQRVDPWAGHAAARQRLTSAMKTLGFKPGAASARRAR